MTPEYDFGILIVDGSKVKNIKSNAFTACDNLHSINFPNTTEIIGAEAFLGCNLSSVRFPNSVTSIGTRAFEVIHGISQVYSFNVTPPTLGNGAFSVNLETGIKIYVPSESVETYKASWIQYASEIQAIP